MASETRPGEPQALRLQVFLSRCGVASRRRCELLIQEGRVAVNGATVTVQGTKVTPADVVTLDGKRLALAKESFYIALNKPRGYICTSHDPEARPLALNLLGGIARRHHIYSIGRLDYLSSGLLLFTNDGMLARAVSHPSSGVEKEYTVETETPVSDEDLRLFVRGVVHQGIRYRIERYERIAPRSVAVVLREGKNRELRNLFQARGISVKLIHRIRIGGVHLRNLKPGEFRFLTQIEVDSLVRAAARPIHAKGPGRREKPGASRLPREGGR